MLSTRVQLFLLFLYLNSMLYELVLSFELHLHPLMAVNLRNLGLRVSHPFAFYALTRRYRVAIMTFVELFSEQKHEF